MIAHVVAALDALVLAPQGADTVPEDRRALVDTSGTPIDVELAELNVVVTGSRPVERAMGTVQIDHTVIVELVVTDGDPHRAIIRRDQIVTDVILRFEADRTLGAAATPDGRQYVHGGDWAVEYADQVRLAGDTPRLGSGALLTFTLSSSLDR